MCLLKNSNTRAMHKAESKYPNSFHCLRASFSSPPLRVFCMFFNGIFIVCVCVWGGVVCVHISHYECESQRIVCGKSILPSQISSADRVHVFSLGDIHLPVESSPHLETSFHVCTDTYMVKFAHLRKSYYSTCP